MIPIFKSHFSIGKSILTLNPPGLSKDGSADSVFDICEDSNLDKIVLIEDSFMGFPEAMKVSSEINKQLVFGIRFKVCSDLNSMEDDKSPDCSHKLIVLSKNSDGIKLLNLIYTESFTKYDGWIDFSLLSKFWDEKNLSLCVPFYDSFIFNNLTSFQFCLVDFSFTKPTFFIEENGLPFDFLVKDSVIEYCKANNFPTQKVKSIFYKNKKDFDAFLSYKLICSRSSFSGREVSIEKPNMDHLGSDEFCFESYLEKCDT